MTHTTSMRPVLVTTAHRGVFFGYIPVDLALIDAKTIALKDARNCLYWDSSVRGFLGLATTGPSSASRIGPAADIVLHDVTCVAMVLPNAETAWKVAQWNN